MLDSSNEELTAIASGTAPGYTELARDIAKAVLRERRVDLPRDLKELRKRAAAAEALADRLREEDDAAHDRSIGWAWGIRLMVIGIGAFVLPLFGYQFRILAPFGYAIPIAATVVAIAGYIIFVQASKQASPQAPHNEEL